MAYKDTPVSFWEIAELVASRADVLNPKTARLRFRMRTLNNLLFVSGIFILSALILSLFPLGFLLILLLGGALYYLFRFVLETRTIGMSCPHCSKYIASNTPWTCGFCRRENRRVNEFPFVHRCEHCTAEAKAYKCHHHRCGKLIFLDADELENNFAHCIGTAVVKSEVTEDESVEREREKCALEHQIIITELSAKLNAAKQRTEVEKKKTPYEKKKESFERHYADSMSVQEIAREKKAENGKKYHNDPEMLQRANEAVDDWIVTET